MIKKRTLTYILTIFFIFLFMDSNAQYRGMAWGSSVNDVERQYGNSDIDDPDGDVKNGFIGYFTKLNGLEVLSGFYFKENKLYAGVYLLDEKHTNSNDYLDDYQKWKDLLTKKYGVPDNDETYWKDDLFKDNYSSWGTAVGYGHLIKYANWKDEENDIECSITGDNFNITVKIFYESVELQDWIEENKEEDNLEDF